MKKETQPAGIEEGGSQDQIMSNMVQETVDPEVKVNPIEREKSPARITRRASTKARKTELEKLLRARGLEMDYSGLSTTEDSAGDGDISGGDAVGESPPTPASSLDPATATATAAPVRSSSVKSPVVHATKKSKYKPSPLPMRVNKHVSLRTRTSVPSYSDTFHSRSKLSKTAENSTTSRSANVGENKGTKDINYENPTLVPGVIEVIFDRYPALHRLASARRGKKRGSNGVNKDFRKMPGIDVFVFLCRKAGSIGRNVAMKAGAENGVAGKSEGLIFLRRNVARTGTRVGVGV